MLDARDPTSFPDRVYATGYFAELTLGELLADPLTRAMMDADHIDPDAAERMLKSVGAGVRAHRIRVKAVAPPHRPPPRRLTYYPSLTPAEPRPISSAIAAKPLKPSCGTPCSW